MARGLFNRRVAEALGISQATVQSHLANLYVKMRVGLREEAIHKALSEGWITVSELLVRQGPTARG